MTSASEVPVLIVREYSADSVAFFGIRRSPLKMPNSPRTRSMMRSATLAASLEMLPSPSPATTPQKNCAASRGSPALPGIRSAVIEAILAA